MKPPFPSPLIVAHRGASSSTPENTLPAFLRAWEEAADAIEGDFHLTADGAVVCHHDPATGRVFEGNHPIASTPLKELRELRLRQPPLRLAESDFRIPTLGEVLALVPAEREVFLELKSGPAIVAPVLSELRQSCIEPEGVAIIAFAPETVAAVHHHAPELRLRLLVTLPPQRPPNPIDLARRLGTRARALGAEGLGLSDVPWLDHDFAKTIEHAGLELHVWTVDDEERARELARLGARSITTNTPAKIRRALREPF